MKKVESLTIENTYEELEMVFESHLKERMSRGSIAKLKANPDSYDLLFSTFKAWWVLWTRWIQKALDKYDVYEKEVQPTNIDPNEKR